MAHACKNLSKSWQRIFWFSAPWWNVWYLLHNSTGAASYPCQFALSDFRDKLCRLRHIRNRRGRLGTRLLQEYFMLQALWVTTKTACAAPSVMKTLWVTGVAKGVPQIRSTDTLKFAVSAPSVMKTLWVTGVAKRVPQIRSTDTLKFAVWENEQSQVLNWSLIPLIAVGKQNECSRLHVRLIER